MLNQTLVLEHPLSLQEALPNSLISPVKSVSQHQNILYVIEAPNQGEQTFARDSYSITFATIDEASLLIDPLSKNLFTPDLILISSQLENYTDNYLSRLKEFCDYRAIPFILYSEEFDPMAKKIAVAFNFDEYYSGDISQALIKKSNFIKKLKIYKHKRHEAPLQASRHSEIPEVKMWAFKRTFDIIVSGGLLMLISPLLLLIALIIKLESKGPVFYISKRAGNGYKIFNFYKFRSMRVGADAELQKLAHLNQYGDTTFFKIQNDPRVTRIGSLLRNSSLDEIPQLLNVLLGDMSLVGNRPLPLYEAEKLTKDQIAWRFIAPAGITGLWQVTKRGKEDMSEEERIQLDMQYAMNNSFLYDIKILLSTIPALLQKEAV